MAENVRTMGPLVPENFWGCQKIFQLSEEKKSLLARHKCKFLVGRKYIELEKN